MSAVAAYRLGRAPRAASLNMRTASFWTRPRGPPTCAARLVRAKPGSAVIARTELPASVSERESCSVNKVFASLESRYACSALYARCTRDVCR